MRRRLSQCAAISAAAIPNGAISQNQVLKGPLPGA